MNSFIRRVVMPKTSTERTREWRERQRLYTAPKRPPKDAAQRCREYRARQKLFRVALQGHLSPPITPPAVDNDGNPVVDPLRLDDDPDEPYSKFHANHSGHREFDKKNVDNPFGFVCGICDRLWFKDELKKITPENQQFLTTKFPEANFNDVMVCNCCALSMRRKHVPTNAKLNGFSYPPRPPHLPNLDLITERLISPRLPFMQIRRLRHVLGQYGIYGQIINVPVSVDTMVYSLPRNIDDDHCIYVHVRRHKIHKTSNVSSLIRKKNIKVWLQHLIETPLYQLCDITINQSFFDTKMTNNVTRDEISEDLSIEDSLNAQQQTLQWNEEGCLRIAPSESNVPGSKMFDEHAEELCFPSIYLGHNRVFKEGLRVTPFMITSSELRRSDRRGVTPSHLLYMAMKTMRLRMQDSFTVSSKHVGKDTKSTKPQIESEEDIDESIQTNLAFLRCIPNSSLYWADRKEDLFAMIRQLGKPTLSLTISANEMGWINLIQTLSKLKNGVEITEEMSSEMDFIQKSTLINEDAVTCVIYFNKMVNSLMSVLQSKKYSPFGKFRVAHYFKRMEFQNHGSPGAHILLWLENAPNDVLGKDREEAITLIDNLISVSTTESSGNIKLQTHKHTFTCFKRIAEIKSQKCRFDAPFMPCRSTRILTPMKKTHPGFAKYAKHYKELKINLEKEDYTDIQEFFEENEIRSDQHYMDILSAGITRPRVFLKRQPSEKWHISFTPFICNVLKASTDIHFITDEYSCAAYVVQHINKPNRGISNLQQKIIEIQDEHPEFDIVEIAKRMSVDMLNTVEMTSQEAAWYLLREPMAKSSSAIVYIPTVRPVERLRMKKTQEQLGQMDLGDDSSDTCKEHWFDKYENRPEVYETVTLAQFVSNFTRNAKNEIVEKKYPRIIRYKNYDFDTELDEYKREMVTLHLPFRNEEADILSDMKYLNLYEQNEVWILQQRKEFEYDLDIERTIEICRQLCREEELPGGEDEICDDGNRQVECNPLQELYNNENSR